MDHTPERLSKAAKTWLGRISALKAFLPISACVGTKSSPPPPLQVSYDQLRIVVTMYKLQLNLPGIFPPGSSPQPTEPSTSVQNSAPSAAPPTNHSPASGSVARSPSPVSTPPVPKPSNANAGDSPDSVLEYRSPSPLPGDLNPGSSNLQFQNLSGIATGSTLQKPGLTSSAALETGPQKRVIPEWMRVGRPTNSKARRVEVSTGGVRGAGVSQTQGEPAPTAETLLSWLQTVEAVRQFFF